MADDARLQEQALASLDSSINAFNNGDAAFFDSFAKDATIFTATSTEPIRGRDAYRRNYQEILKRNKRQKTITDRSVQVVGDQAVVTFTAQVKQGDVTVDVRQTLIYGSTDEGVKILHSHTAVAGTPVSVLTNDGGITDARTNIQVVSERIATVARVLGVAQ
jgi:ketosteroid isomerase-like protein